MMRRRGGPMQGFPVRAAGREGNVPHYWPEAVEHLRASDPVLARIIAGFGSERLVWRDDPFLTLARSIVGQQISVAAASAVWRRFEDLMGRVEPRAVAGAAEEGLRRVGLSGRKVTYLKDLAGHFLSGEIDPGSWAHMEDAAVVGELTRVKGIGQWTAEMFLIFGLLRPDVLPLDDIGLQRAMGLHYGAQRKLARDEMTRVAARWRPWRSVATWYLWRSLDPEPVDY
jgi:DNA-3-methyladenine glycosylase II